MDAFVKQHAARIAGTLEGFDRLVFRGTLPTVNNLRSLIAFLYHFFIKSRDFGA